MSRRRAVILAIIALTFVGIGVYLGVVDPGGRDTSFVVYLVMFYLVIIALAGTPWRGRSATGESARDDSLDGAPEGGGDGAVDGDGDGVADERRTAAGSFATPSPERTGDDDALSAEWLAGEIERAGATAREEGTVDDGLATVRPALREALRDALVQGGQTPSDVDRHLEAGTWTDDVVAASLLDEAVAPPELSLRERIYAWLFPERVVASWTRYGMQAVAEAADRALPVVPGQHAPRTVPVAQTPLETLQRDVDGTLQRAVDPGSVERGSRPPDPSASVDPETGPTDDSTETSATSGSAGARESLDAAAAAGRLTDADRSASVRRRSLRGGVTATVVLVVVGLVDQNGTMLLASLVPLLAVVYGLVARVEPPEGLVASREIEPSPAAPGAAVTVTLRVRNASGRTVPDVRIVDGVPGPVAVIDGTPRAGTTLEPGEEVVVRYLVTARRGEYDFDPPQLRVRGIGGGVALTTTLATAGDRSLVCRLDADAPPIEEFGHGRVGPLDADLPGEGISFHSTREYHPNDPASRIDWRHYAKRGTLATVNYERHVSATVVLVVDARAPNRVVAGPGLPSAVELGAYAATHALTDLLGRGHDVGVALVGLDGPGPAGLHWLPPGNGREQRFRAVELFGLAIEADGHSAREQAQLEKVAELAPPGAQIASFSPLLDDPPVEAVETWRRAGLPVVVCSPDVVPENTVSGQYEQVRRRTRLARCQAARARTVDWRRGTPLALVVEHAFAVEARRPTSGLAGRPARGGL